MPFLPGFAEKSTSKPPTAPLLGSADATHKRTHNQLLIEGPSFL